MAKEDEVKYLILTDSRFINAARAELSASFETRIIDRRMYNDVTMLIASLERKNPETPLANNARLAFVDFVMKIDHIIEDADNNPEKINAYLTQAITANKYDRFMLEIKKIQSKFEGSAKAIEVLLGQGLEKDGIYPNLIDPEIVIFIILIEGQAIIGHANAFGPSSMMDYFRYGTKTIKDPINRAELKIVEAINYFGIDFKDTKICLDIGAAPGGWTHCLLQHNLKVVAVDYSDLEYEKLGNEKDVLIITEPKDLVSTQESTRKLSGNHITVAELGSEIPIKDYDVVHLKSHVDRNDLNDVLNKLGKFDLLCIDINAAPAEVLPMVNSLADNLNQGAHIIMTAKLATEFLADHVKEVKDGLAEKYTDIQIKKLAHNRMEFTVYAELK